MTERSSWKYDLFGFGLYIRATPGNPASDKFYLQTNGKYFKIFPAGLKGAEMVRVEAARLLVSRALKPDDLWIVYIYQRQDGFLCLRRLYEEGELKTVRVTPIEGEFNQAGIPALG